MYLSTGGSLKFFNKDIIAVYLTDYLKATTIIFNLNFFDGKMFSTATIPPILKNYVKNFNGSEIFEIISLVDFINEAYESIVKMKENLSNTKAVIVNFPNVDFSVYANTNNKAKKDIFEEYKSIKYVYEKILETRRLIENVKKNKTKHNEIIDFNIIYEHLNKFITNEDTMRFLEDFKYLSSKEISLSIKNRFLNNIKQLDFTALHRIQPCGIFERSLNYLSPLNFTYQVKLKSNGMLCDFSNYIYLLSNHDKLNTENSTYIKELKTISNSVVLDKIIHLREDTEGLQNFISSVVNKTFIKTLIKSGNTNELMKLIDEHEDLFTSNNNDSIFIACLLIQTKEGINKKRTAIEKDIKNIITKHISLEYRMAEIELYMKKLMSELLDNKRLFNSNVELDTIFYNSIAKLCYEIIYKCFDDSVSDTQNESNDEKNKTAEEVEYEIED